MKTAAEIEEGITSEVAASEIPSVEVADVEVPDASAASVTDHEKRSEPPQQRSGGGSLLLWLVLLVVVAVGGLLLVPNPWQERAHSGLALLQSWWQPVAVKPVHPASKQAEKGLPSEATDAPLVARVVAAVPISESVVKSVADPQADEPITEPVVEPVAVPPPVESVAAVAPAVAVDDPLNQKIALLNQQLARVANSQKQLVAQQHALASASLRQQISMLSSPTTGLPQMAQGWQQVARRTRLDSASRHRAEQIAAEAERLLVQRQRWQHQLQNSAKQLIDMEHGQHGKRRSLRDIPALADFPLTHWLDQQFTLYHLPTAAQQRKHRFAVSLQQMAAAMDDERWPSAKEWRAVRQQISYWLDPEQVASLPQGFDGVRQQLKQLRQQQIAWLGEVK